jgi:hypothetical protein
MVPVRTRYARPGLLAAAAWLVLAPCAPAADVHVAGRLTPGHLAISAPAARVSIQRQKARVSAVLAVPLTVVDTRGSGAGWAIALTAGAVTPHGAIVRGLSLAVRGFRMRCASCTRPVDRVRYPVAVRLGQPTRVFRAARNSGMGVMRLEGILGLTGQPRPASASITLRVRLAQVSGP